MSNNADDDVASAVAAQWKNTAALVAAVPGGLEQDRLTAAQPDAQPRKDRAMPYAKLTVGKFADPDLSTGGVYIDRRHVTIELRGMKAAVSQALDLARAAFIQQVLPMPAAQYPKVVGGRAMAVLEIGTDDLHKDPAVRQGEDIWIGTLEMAVWAHRSY